LNLQNLVGSTKYTLTPLVFHTKSKAFHSNMLTTLFMRQTSWSRSRNPQSRLRSDPGKPK
jgi:hypothetical protein